VVVVEGLRVDAVIEAAEGERAQGEEHGDGGFLRPEAAVLVEEDEVGELDPGVEEDAGGEKKDKKKKEDDEKQEEEEEEAEEEEDEEGAVKEEPKDTVKNYATFLEQYSKSIKLGIVEDAKNRKKLAKFVRFRSTKTKDGESVSLQRYIDRMAVGQKHVYYITGDDHKELLKSPYLEKLLKRGYEVLVMTDPMDEYMMQHLDEFEDHTFVNVAKEDIKFGDKQEKAEKKRAEKKKEDL
jgi:heat shock protein beta